MKGLLVKGPLSPYYPPEGMLGNPKPNVLRGGQRPPFLARDAWFVHTPRVSSWHPCHGDTDPLNPQPYSV